MLALPGGHVDAWRVLAPELDGVGEEVLKHQDKLRCVGEHRRQGVVGDDGLVLSDHGCQVPLRQLEDRPGVGGF